jgi:hypothetical protein
MTKQEWAEILNIAENFGDECKRVIEEMGRERFTAMQRRLIQQSGSHAEKTPVEWVRAMWRYHDAISGRTFTERELDKIERWAFVWHCLQDQVTDQFQTLSLASGVTGRDNPHILLIGEGLAKCARAEERAKEASEVVKKFKEHMSKTLAGDVDLAIKGYQKQIENAIGYWQHEVDETAAHMRRSLKVVEDLARLATVDASLAKAKQDSLKNIAKEIETIETELQLRVNRGEDSGAVLMTKMLDKFNRYVEDNPQFFMWHCPECDWEGTLLKRLPPEGSSINAMSKWWTWQCPACRNIIAYDRKHPQFDKNGVEVLVFNKRAWELICKGDISLQAVAYILEVTPEYITYTAEEKYRMQIPAHVREELEQYEQEGLEDYDEETVPDDEDLYPV